MGNGRRHLTQGGRENPRYFIILEVRLPIHRTEIAYIDLFHFYFSTFDIRRVEEESEDSYFNGDDEDDEDDIDSPPPPLPLTLPNLPNISPRQHKPKHQQRSWQKRAIGQQKWPITPGPRGLQIPRSPSIDMLMEYGDDDEDLSPVGTIASVNLEEEKNKDREAFVPSPTPSPDSRPTPTGEKEAPPATPRISHRQILSTKRSRDDLEGSAAGPGANEDSDEDVGMIGPMPLSPSEDKSSGFTPLRPEKRRRQADEDEDDLALERLASRGKRSSVGGGESPNSQRSGPGKGGSKDTVAATGTALGKVAGAGGEDGPGQVGGSKKIKLKFGSTGLAVASSSPTPTPESRSEPDTKDGDTG